MAAISESNGNGASFDGAKNYGDGFSVQELFGERRENCQAFTFDDVIMMPGLVPELQSEVSLTNRISRRIQLNVPMLSSPMDTVTEHAMAIGE